MKLILCGQKFIKKTEQKIEQIKQQFPEIEFHKKVKLIMVDFYDEGCFYPETTFNFKNINRKTTESHKNNSFETHNIIFNESELLNDMTFFEIQHCEGTTSRIVIIYE